MKAGICYRIGSGLSVLFALGHTWGFLRFVAPNAEARQVWAEMGAVHFSVGQRDFTYSGFYHGFGLIITAFEIFLAALMWWLANRSRERISGLISLTWILFALELVIAVLSVLFFGPGPTVLAVLAALALIGAGFDLRKNRSTV